MLISFTGAQSTGKSTLLERMVSDVKFRKCSFIKEVTRKVARQGVNINDSGDNITQLLILSEHINNHIMRGCTVLDRCIVDGLIYTEWLYNEGKVDKWVYEYAVNLHNALLPKLDIIFYTNPVDVPLVNDGQRSVNKEFREGIIQLYNEYYERNTIAKDKTVTLSGTVDQRYKTITNTLKNHDTTR